MLPKYPKHKQTISTLYHSSKLPAWKLSSRCTQACSNPSSKNPRLEMKQAFYLLFIQEKSIGLLDLITWEVHTMSSVLTSFHLATERVKSRNFNNSFERFYDATNAVFSVLSSNMTSQDLIQQCLQLSITSWTRFCLQDRCSTKFASFSSLLSYFVLVVIHTVVEQILRLAKI